jgi:large subunit ribosomal protein L27e
VAGIERYPRKIVKAMGAKKIEKRSKIKPFVKVINFSHLMPTRHSVDFDLEELFKEGALKAENKEGTKKAVRKLFEDKFRNPQQSTGKAGDKKLAGAQYLFTKLRF